MQDALRKQLEKLEKQHRKISRTGLTGETRQYIELFFAAMENGKHLLELSKQLQEKLDGDTEATKVLTLNPKKKTYEQQAARATAQ